MLRNSIAEIKTQLKYFLVILRKNVEFPTHMLLLLHFFRNAKLCQWWYQFIAILSFFPCFLSCSFFDLCSLCLSTAVLCLAYASFQYGQMCSIQAIHANFIWLFSCILSIVLSFSFFFLPVDMFLEKVVYNARNYQTKKCTRFDTLIARTGAREIDIGMTACLYKPIGMYKYANSWQYREHGKRSLRCCHEIDTKLV